MQQPVVLFLCTDNSARSQMAEALLKKHAGDRFEVHSAGLRPQGVHRLTARVLEEVGIATQSLRSKPIREFLGRLSVNHVVFVCADAEKHCPNTYPFALHAHSWPFPDPVDESEEEQQLSNFRRVRDQIEARIQAWLAELEANR